MTAIYVVITETQGSAPRDAGTAMAVTDTTIEGTIGGGALEYQAITRARALLAEGRTAEETLPLGPGLGQCCGGVVRLRYTYAPQTLDAPCRFDEPFQHPCPQGRALWVWGAGHVGRAIVRAARDAAFTITWLDDAIDRFPNPVPPDVHVLPGRDLPRLALHADLQAAHVILTYSHDIDLALCDALLRRGVSDIGLIGSDTKWARFRKRLSTMGHSADQISRITCPIGIKALGKRPDAIAEGVIRRLDDGARGKKTG